uniref:PadR family transcriptional regulator n=1 Tax=Eubacterium sp. TaxID=142586 RepID=UPI004029D0E1
MKISKELISGSTTMLVLSVIKNEDMYGYKIIRELEVRSEYAFSFKEGTLYPILHALEKERLVESYWVTADGRKRKYYHITKKGAKRLEEKEEEIKEFSVSVSKVLNYA